MAQSPGGNGGPSAPSGGSSGSNGGKSSPSSSSKGSRSSSKSSGKGQAKSSTKRGTTELNANIVPAHHAHHGMSGTYTTKGKFATMPDGSGAFEG